MEVEAFDRARAFDAGTIIRQNEIIAGQRREIDRLEKEVRGLEVDKRTLEDDNRRLSNELGDCVRNQGDGQEPRVP
ncbi:hypothetical protein SEA_PHEROBRINE_35 [Gordonia phage Pherobrine]|nr:hypothetical protein SEA_PHEROBRINE_35 [Gordonia phage Pherobrine]